MTVNGEYYGRREANKTLDEEFLDEDMLPWRQAELLLSIPFDSSVRLQNRTMALCSTSVSQYEFPIPFRHLLFLFDPLSQFAVG
jgi:hypothetical protein